MKPGTTSKPFPRTAEKISSVIEAAPERIHDPESAYDPADPKAVEAFWKGSSVRRPGQRGVGKKAKKILLSVRYSPEVVQYFKSTGEGWQTRMDDALKEWLASHGIDPIASGR
ncbi:MAG TPA: BrnA antitoxin family protein [Thermoanaerobaculia bacterium]|jgi:uncharacterized protein (DUF4415 family)|nr:BrnA antitoxin family protein [Thermoanaerobaculia bacterium]